MPFPLRQQFIGRQNARSVMRQHCRLVFLHVASALAEATFKLRAAFR